MRVLTGLDANGYKIYTLDELGIKSIDLNSNTTNVTGDQGNTQVRAGSFQWASGSTGLIGEYFKWNPCVLNPGRRGFSFRKSTHFFACLKRPSGREALDLPFFCLASNDEMASAFRRS
jgi:hypothetical protein